MLKFLSIITVVAVSLPYTHSFLFSVLGGNPQHINPFLVSACRAIPPMQNSRVKCVYHPTELVCTSTCDSGYSIDGTTNIATLKCSSTRGWYAGDQFPMCKSSGNTGTGTNTGTMGCIRSLKDCPDLGDYQACHSCTQFVTCANDGVFLQDCPAGTFFDANLKRCALQSSTCTHV